MNDLSALIQNKLAKQRSFFKTHQTLPVSFRLQALKQLRKAIIENEDLLMGALKKDLKKSKFEAFATEIGIVIKELDFHIRHLKKWARPKRVKSSLIHFKSRHYIYSEPYGISLIIAPWNYPLLLLMSPLIGSISGGNCSILKPSPYAKHTAEAMEHIISQYFDENYICFFQGGREVNKALLAEKFDYIFFTGSKSLGKIVMKSAADHITPVTLELGGKSPCIVDNDANLKFAARRIIWGKFINAGQTCIAPDYLLIHENIKEKFYELLKENIKRFYGNFPKKSPDYGRIVNEQSFNRLTSYLANLNIITGGESDIKEYYIAPTLVDQFDLNHQIMVDEIFGPILPIITFSNLKEVIELVNSKPKPLALYYFSRNAESQNEILKNISSGGACINDTIMQIASSRLPFGGVGESGMGSYHGKSSFETFSHKRSLIKKAQWIDVPLRYAPSAGKLKWIKILMKNNF